MPAQSKFTADRRRLLLEAYSVGASTLTAARHARLDEATVRRWLKRGESAKSGSLFRKFWEDVQESRSRPNLRALALVQEQMPDHPLTAWKWIERREPGFAPPMPDHAPAAVPQIVVLTLDDGRSAPALTAVPNEAEPEAS